MDMLGNSREVWLVITGDGRIQKNKAERLAFRQAKLIGFVLAPAYQKTPINQQASILIWRWPEIEVFVTQLGGGSLFELPISKSGKFKPMPL
ncbi:hypothetical protein AA14337_0331 [Acetobacter malorum DSM 14337]|uniref:VapC45 PIN like domain-containing protein n=2 Tax=Acetobacter malorum TaxID=178901 RepID=A0ABQ0PMB1_9PROT|nr:hypothetical protein AA14337_0331 [Acetobacter malorum DSM 14337]